MNHLSWTFTQIMIVLGCQSFTMYIHSDNDCAGLSIIYHVHSLRYLLCWVVNHLSWTFTQIIIVLGCESFTMDIHPDNDCAGLLIICHAHDPDNDCVELPIIYHGYFSRQCQSPCWTFQIICHGHLSGV